MTLLNHIGVFIILIIIFYVVSVFEEKDISFENFWISIGCSTFCMIVFEAIYWTVRIFFLN